MLASPCPARRFPFVPCALLALVALPGSAEEAPTSALLFKSGQSALTREVRVEPGASTLRIGLPAAIHGTVWLEVDGARIRDAVARQAERDETRAIEDLEDVLRAAVGKRVALEIDGSGPLVGTLERLLGERPSRRDDADAGFSTLTARTLRGTLDDGGFPRPRGRSSVAVRSRDALRILPVDRVLGVTLLDEAAPEWTVHDRVEHPVLDVRFDGPIPPEGAVLRLRSMAGGLAWAPSYRLRLADADGDGRRGGTARLTGKAAIVNDGEDLRDTEVRLVIGYPNLEHAHVDSALSPDRTLEQWVRQLEWKPPSRRRAPSMMNQMVAVPVGNFDEVGDAFVASLPGDPSEDLYVYRVGPLTLARGERAYVPLSTEDVAVEDRFDWTRATRVRNGRFRDADDPDEEAEAVWHVLTLANGGDSPWTTAPILIETDAGPLAQSRLSYTASGTRSTVRMTKALDLAAVGRERRADSPNDKRPTVRMFNATFERVEVAGTLELKNRGRRTAPMRVTQSLRGDVLGTSGDPRVDAPVGEDDLDAVNAARTLTWEFELAPGATWSAEYRYAVLIRR